ncbi:G1/S-specific cyclin-E1 [Ambystoma mexicanum]|uniref:G1/S-specific cyclin-E1 n=1 Tax=Ambystoma mexicanum TaxID=8296 RepID=UPI0037E92A98
MQTASYPEERALWVDSGVRSRKRKADVAIHLQDPDEEVAQIEMNRKKQYEQGSWDQSICRSPHRLIPTPEKEDRECRLGLSPFAAHRFTPVRASPLPILQWGSKDVVWKNMVHKEHSYVRDKHFMQRHPQLQPKMRSILVDWLMEVCEVYKLHRDTFYLAQDLFDRFMSTQQNVVKTRLQLIGISALFIAAKLEEIYPPKLYQFAYVTDGACTEDDILKMELIVMKSLGWSLSPLTIVSWLNIYMQVAYLKEDCEVLLPQYPQQIFVQITELLDVCVLDLGCLEFTYGVLAACALYHFSSLELVAKVSGYRWSELEECATWMIPFAMTIKEAGSSPLRQFRGVAPEDLHNIQTHINSLDLLDKAQAKQAVLAEENRTSPVPSGVLTPPQSSKKHKPGLLALA